MHGWPQTVRHFFTGRDAGWWAMRVVWGIFALGHLPPLLARCSDPSTLLSALPLLLSELYFLLKVADVAWLRIPRDRRAWTAFIVIVVLLHAPVLTDAALHADTNLIPWHLAVWPLMLALVTLSIQTQRTLWPSLVATILGRCRQRWRWLRRWDCAYRLPSRFADLLLASLSVHAPPHRAV